DEQTLVEGYLTDDGLFDGTIVTSNQKEFYIEPAKRYFQTSQPFHTIMYSVDDVVFPAKASSSMRHDDHQHRECASHLLHLRRIEEGVWRHHHNGDGANTSPIIDCFLSSSSSSSSDSTSNDESPKGM